MKNNLINRPNTKKVLNEYILVSFFFFVSGIYLGLIMEHNSIMCEIQNDQIRGTMAAA